MNSTSHTPSTPGAGAAGTAAVVESRPTSALGQWLRFLVMMVVFTCVLLGLLRIFVPQAVPSLFSDAKQSTVRRGQATGNIKWILDALFVYRHDHGGQYPSTLDPLILPRADGRTYFGESRAVPLDPWGHPFLYEPPRPDHPNPRVYSLGADARPGGEGENTDVDSDRMQLDR